MLRSLVAGAAAISAFLPAHAHAQTQAEGELTLFNRGHFGGARRTVIGPTQYIPEFVARSIQIPAGTQWELCSGNKFSGCRQFNKSTPAMVMTVRSARPVAAVLPAAAATLAPGQSLRGVASEYFVAPDQGGRRVAVEQGTAEAGSQRAHEFCRSRGWRSSAHERLQTVEGGVYLADVLCVETGE